jgi:hypothetical protein
LEEWEQEPKSAVKEKALVEAEWLGQVLALNPLRVLPESKVEIAWAEQVSGLEPLQAEPEPGSEIPRSLEIERGQE